MKEFFRLARQPRVVQRALKSAVVVGLVLLAINHGDALLHGEMTRGRWFKMALTVLVPYAVSTVSSVQAMRDLTARPGRTDPSQNSGGGANGEND